MPCLRETPQDASAMPSGKTFVVGAIDGKQILSQPMWPLVAEFLEHLFQRTPSLAINTIRGYRSAFSSTLYNVVDLTNSVFLRNLLKNMDRQCPKYKELCPKWNLALVLAYITSPPFEPIMKASLWHLPLKTVFLLKLASGCHRNELHALSW